MNLGAYEALAGQVLRPLLRSVHNWFIGDTRFFQIEA